MKNTVLALAVAVALTACGPKAAEAPKGLLSKADIVGTWMAIDGGEMTFKTYQKEPNDTTVANTAANLAAWGVTLGPAVYKDDGSYTAQMTFKTASGQDSSVTEVGTWALNGDTVSFQASSPKAYSMRYLNTAYQDGVWQWKTLDPYDFDEDGEVDDFMSGASKKAEAPAPKQ